MPRSGSLKGRSPRLRAVVFDLDGTLVDSLVDLTTSINLLIAARGALPFVRTEVLKFVGDGIDALVERAFSARGVVVGRDELRDAIAQYERLYGAQMTVSTELYAGAMEVISELRRMGIKIGVCTNKSEDKAVGILEGVKLKDHIDVIVGARKGRRGKPSAAPLLEALRHLDVGPADAIMVGDSAVDLQCARAAGTAMMGVTFGYSQIPMRELNADITIDHYSEFMTAYHVLAGRVP